MQLPPKLLQVSHLGVTGGAGAITTTTLLAGAATFRYRLWGVTVAGLTTRTGILWFEVRDGAGTPYVEVNAPVGGTGYAFIPGGIALLDGLALQVRDQSNVAAQSVRGHVFYTIERSS